MSRQIIHHYANVNSIKIFYREAGSPLNPTILLLHGFPTSSLMFRNLMIMLSDKYHLIAPDYPGFGFSDFPLMKDFDYSFDNIALCMDRFTQTIGLISFSIYLHDYGCPIGLRICLEHPERIMKIIIQNGNAYEEGLGSLWDATKDYWKNPTLEKKKKVSAFLSKKGTREQYIAGLPEDLLQLASPESWIVDWERMSRPRNIRMQFRLNTTYQTNIKMFSLFQEYFRNHHPPALVLWGKHDVFYDVAEAYCYKRDLPDAELYVLNGGHMLLETNFDEVSVLIIQFLSQ